MAPWPGWERFDPTGAATEPARRSKFNAQPTTRDGQRFDSKSEAARWNELQLLEQAGEIAGLQRQVPFGLNVIDTHGLTVCIGRWVADFVYTIKATGKTVVEDRKGGKATKTPLYRWKVAHFKAQYGFNVLET